MPGHDLQSDAEDLAIDGDSVATKVRRLGVRELARNVSGVIDGVSRTGLPAIVTKHGVPVAAVVPIGYVGGLPAPPD